MSTTPSAFVIELPEGSLAIHDLSVGTPAPDAPVVLAVHGITANGLSWRRVADEVVQLVSGANVKPLEVRLASSARP